MSDFSSPSTPPASAEGAGSAAETPAAPPPATAIPALPAPGDTLASYPEAWKNRVGPFAASVGKSLDEITRLLAPVVGEPGDDALAILSDVAASPDADIKAALAGLGIPSGKFNINVLKLRGALAAPAATSVSASGPMQALAILPSVPEGASFIESLKTGGILKVGVTEVISAVKAAFAKGARLYDLPDLILNRMEQFAIAQEQPAGELFFKTQKLLTEKRYGDILSALGVTGAFVSEKRKKEFLDRLDNRLWSALSSFQTQLVAWQQAWMQGAMNPAAMMLAMTSSHAGGIMPPGMMNPPDTAPVRASGEEVVNEVNRIFAGAGIPIARALAYDATRIMTLLDDPTLPPQIGAGSKEQMLKELGVNVGADMVRTEQGLARYTLAVMSLKDVAADAEIQYLGAMISLGSSIPWDKLSLLSGGSGRPGIGGGTPPPRRAGSL